MSSLSTMVRSFVIRARRNISDVSPSALEALDIEASRGLDGAYATLTAPLAPDTVNIDTILNRLNDNTTNRIPFSFPSPVEIVGIYPSIVSLDLPADEAFPAPTTNDVKVLLDINNKHFLTSAGVTTQLSQQTQFVTLAALGVLVPRLTGIKIENAKPDIGFTYRWRAPNAIKQWKSSIIGVDLFCRYLVDTR